MKFSRPVRPGPPGREAGALPTPSQGERPSSLATRWPGSPSTLPGSPPSQGRGGDGPEALGCPHSEKFRRFRPFSARRSPGPRTTCPAGAPSRGARRAGSVEPSAVAGRPSVAEIRPFLCPKRADLPARRPRSGGPRGPGTPRPAWAARLAPGTPEGPFPTYQMARVAGNRSDRQSSRGRGTLALELLGRGEAPDQSLSDRGRDWFFVSQNRASSKLVTHPLSSSYPWYYFSYPW